MYNFVGVNVNLLCYMICFNEKSSSDYSAWLWRVRLSIASEGASEKDFAKFLGIDPANLSRILNGKVIPSIAFYFQFGEFLKTLNPLLYGEK